MDLAGIVILIDAAEDEFAAIGFIVTLIVVKPEGEEALVDKLAVHHVIEGWDDTLDGNVVVAKTKDAIKATKGKSKAGLLDRLGKVLLLNSDIADLEDILGLLFFLFF